MINGKTEISFVPSPQMYAFAMARSLPHHAHLDDKQVMETMNYNGDVVVRWRREYNPHFDEWLEGYLLTHTSKKMLKAMLESVGVKKAMEGEFNFWKALSLREGVIKPDSMNLNVIPIDLGKINDLDPEQLEGAKQALLESLRTPRDDGSTEMDGAAEEKGPQGHPTGATEV
jgi:hypothetical protein